jgi:hypothetical protein
MRQNFGVKRNLKGARFPAAAVFLREMNTHQRRQNRLYRSIAHHTIGPGIADLVFATPPIRPRIRLDQFMDAAQFFVQTGFDFSSRLLHKRIDLLRIKSAFIFQSPPRFSLACRSKRGRRSSACPG